MDTLTPYVVEEKVLDEIVRKYKGSQCSTLNPGSRSGSQSFEISSTKNLVASSQKIKCACHSGI